LDNLCRAFLRGRKQGSDVPWGGVLTEPQYQSLGVLCESLWQRKRSLSKRQFLPTWLSTSSKMRTRGVYGNLSSLDRGSVILYRVSLSDISRAAAASRSCRWRERPFARVCQEGIISSKHARARGLQFLASNILAPQPFHTA